VFHLYLFLKAFLLSLSPPLIQGPIPLFFSFLHALGRYGVFHHLAEGGQSDSSPLPFSFSLFHCYDSDGASDPLSFPLPEGSLPPTSFFLERSRGNNFIPRAPHTAPPTFFYCFETCFEKLFFLMILLSLLPIVMKQP